MIKWNEVTWYSKLGAIILFIGIVPALCFYIGTQFELVQQSMTVAPRQQNIPTTSVAQQSSSATTATYGDPKVAADLEKCATASGSSGSPIEIRWSDCLTAATQQYQAIETKTDADFDKCQNNPDFATNVGWQDCLGVASQGYDAVERAQYTILSEEIKHFFEGMPETRGPDFYGNAAASLPSAETAWNSYRESICSIVDDFFTTGTGGPGASADCYNALTKKHIQDLIDAAASQY